MIKFDLLAEISKFSMVSFSLNRPENSPISTLNLNFPFSFVYATRVK